MKNTKTPVILSFLMSIFILSISFYFIKRSNDDHRLALKNSLETIFNTTVQSLDSWVEAKKDLARFWTNSKELQKKAKDLIELERKTKSNLQNTIINSRAEKEIRDLLNPFVSTTSFKGYFVISKSYINLASSRNSNTGINTLEKSFKEYIDDAFNGKITLSPILTSDVQIKNRNRNLSEYTMFVFSPIYDGNSINSVFALRIDPSAHFTALLQRGRMGESGETYTFNGEGLMLSSSRFIEELKSLRLLSKNEDSSIGNIYIKSPTYDLKESTQSKIDQKSFPLTEMAKSATNKENSLSLDPYPDYRGVNVVGVWNWIENLKMGITTEINYEEAYSPLRKIEKSIYTLAIISILLIWLSYYLFNKFQKETLLHTKDLEKFNSELEETVQSRTRQAQEANNAKSIFLANMSHEMRTPLTSIIAITEIIQNENMDKNERIEYIKQISSSGDFLLSLINDVLDLSKIESENIELEYLPRSLKEITQQVCSGLKIKADARNNSISHSFNLTHDLYNVDPIRLKQILYNIISNAIKFTENGNIHINVEEKNEKVAIEIKDSGIGISKEKINSIFSPFKQADEKTTRKFGGTGLGLSITKKLVSLMEGSIFVSSEENKGSIFTITLPLERVQSSKEEESPYNFTLDKEAIKRLKIIVAEDTKINNKLLVVALRKQGIPEENITSAFDGQEALALALNVHTDIIFMDCMMPNMDGYEASTKIKDSLLDKAPYIIAITANVFKEDQEKCVKAKMDYFIAKPFKHADISMAFSEYQKKIKS